MENRDETMGGTDVEGRESEERQTTRRAETGHKERGKMGTWGQSNEMERSGRRVAGRVAR